jgi:magnesium chelatase family protein
MVVAFDSQTTHPRSTRMSSSPSAATLPLTSSATTAFVIGVEAFLSHITLEVADGLPGIDIVGLNEAAVREARVRVRGAIVACGVTIPSARITVTIAPPHVRKDTTGLDLPIAAALLAALGLVDAAHLANTALFGELALDGSVRPVRSMLPCVEAASAARRRFVIVPEDNAHEASLVPGVGIKPIRHLKDLAHVLTRDAGGFTTQAHHDNRPAPDLAEVRGQQPAKRALEIAAAGGHNMLLVGGPGSGKTMLARRFPGILPAMTSEEALEVTRIASVAGLNIGGGLVRNRPFRAPHHSTTSAGLVGGGAPLARPGELSLAHMGVLFLDELPEFPRQVLEMLVEPLDSGEVALSRAAGVVTYPARTTVIAAMNPCPCGQLGHPRLRCRCDTDSVRRYTSRVSPALLKRFDLHVDVPPVDLSTLGSGAVGESSAVVAVRVAAARARQITRQGKPNARLEPGELQHIVRLDDNGRALMIRAMERLGLSGQGYDGVRRVARTIADLEGEEEVRSAHVAEALQLRARTDG